MLPDIWYLLFDTFYFNLSYSILSICYLLSVLADLQNMILVIIYLISLAKKLFPLAPIVRLALVFLIKGSGLFLAMKTTPRMETPKMKITPKKSRPQKLRQL